MKRKVLTILMYLILAFIGCSKLSESNTLKEAKSQLENLKEEREKDFQQKNIILKNLQESN